MNHHDDPQKTQGVAGDAAPRCATWPATARQRGTPFMEVPAENTEAGRPWTPPANLSSPRTARVSKSQSLTLLQERFSVQSQTRGAGHELSRSTTSLVSLMTYRNNAKRGSKMPRSWSSKSTKNRDWILANISEPQSSTVIQADHQSFEPDDASIASRLERAEITTTMNSKSRVANDELAKKEPAKFAGKWTLPWNRPSNGESLSDLVNKGFFEHKSVDGSSKHRRSRPPTRTTIIVHSRHRHQRASNLSSEAVEDSSEDELKEHGEDQDPMFLLSRAPETSLAHASTVQGHAQDSWKPD